MASVKQPPGWNESLELEKRIKNEMRKKSFWDPEIRRLRLNLQHAYESIIFANFEFAQANEVEQNLWKSVFYKPIEEFRGRIRAAGQAVAQAEQAAAGAAAAVAPSASAQEARMQQQKLTAAYLKFLDEAVAFYKRLVFKLQWVYGSVGATVEVDASVQNEIQGSMPRASSATARDCHLAVHRCLIYLGDLCRYQAHAMKVPKPEWSRAIAFYRAAAEVLPSSGNPFNQLAVMAYYAQDELRAVYYYFRSLAVAMPFQTARENLLLLFERNRGKYAQIPARHAAAAVANGDGSNTDAKVAAVLAADVATRFVRLHGMLFDKINLDQFADVRSRAFEDLHALLGNAAGRELLLRHLGTDSMLMHLAVLCIFTAHYAVEAARPRQDAAGPAGGGAPRPPAGYAEVTQRSLLQRYALTVIFQFAVVMCGGLGALPAGDPLLNTYATATLVVLTWLALHPGVLASPSTAEGATDKDEDIVLRTEFWRAASRLVSKLAETMAGSGLVADVLDGLAAGLARLPEDLELRGFEPLKVPEELKHGWPLAAGDSQTSMRAKRLLSVCRTMATHLDTILGQRNSSSMRGLQNYSQAVAEYTAAVKDAVAGRQPTPAAAAAMAAATPAPAAAATLKPAAVTSWPQPTSMPPVPSGALQKSAAGGAAAPPAAGGGAAAGTGPPPPAVAHAPPNLTNAGAIHLPIPFAVGIATSAGAVEARPGLQAPGVLGAGRDGVAHAAAGMLQQAPDGMEEGEEEEVIVFRPSAKLPGSMDAGFSTGLTSHDNSILRTNSGSTLPFAQDVPAFSRPPSGSGSAFAALAAGATRTSREMSHDGNTALLHTTSIASLEHNVDISGHASPNTSLPASPLPSAGRLPFPHTLPDASHLHQNQQHQHQHQHQRLLPSSLTPAAQQLPPLPPGLPTSGQLLTAGAASLVRPASAGILQQAGNTSLPLAAHGTAGAGQALAALQNLQGAQNLPFGGSYSGPPGMGGTLSAPLPTTLAQTPLPAGSIPGLSSLGGGFPFPTSVNIAPTPPFHPSSADLLPDPATSSRSAMLAQSTGRPLSALGMLGLGATAAAPPRPPPLLLRAAGGSGGWGAAAAAAGAPYLGPYSGQQPAGQLALGSRGGTLGSLHGAMNMSGADIFALNTNASAAAGAALGAANAASSNYYADTLIARNLEATAASVADNVLSMSPKRVSDSALHAVGQSASRLHHAMHSVPAPQWRSTPTAGLAPGHLAAASHSHPGSSLVNALNASIPPSSLQQQQQQQQLAAYDAFNLPSREASAGNLGMQQGQQLFGGYSGNDIASSSGGAAASLPAADVVGYSFVDLLEAQHRQQATGAVEEQQQQQQQPQLWPGARQPIQTMNPFIS